MTCEGVLFTLFESFIISSNTAVTLRAPPCLQDFTITTGFDAADAVLTSKLATPLSSVFPATTCACGKIVTEGQNICRSPSDSSKTWHKFSSRKPKRKSFNTSRHRTPRSHAVSRSRRCVHKELQATSTPIKPQPRKPERWPISLDCCELLSFQMRAFNGVPVHIREPLP